MRLQLNIILNIFLNIFLMTALVLAQTEGCRDVHDGKHIGRTACRLSAGAGDAMCLTAHKTVLSPLYNSSSVICQQ